MIPDDDVLPAPVLKSLTHLYCEFVAPWGTDTNSVEISVGSYPSLTHVALNTVNVDSEEELDPSWDIPEAVGKWLDIPSLKKLILRFPSDDSDVMEQYCTSELGAKQITDRRVICVRMPVGEPSNNDDHFALLDRVWELGEEAYTNNVTA
ncbi:hypothetical protein BDP27DRAFT_1318139 [Rhodocollybia butyracea]|uniref:Uncharacterized protein n=1 Tax=Rhodocollybia butyracea TaxID=206335 RepID=A0A9P5UD24_9AGAR|nr:hypothetical protein BDP27DRAFT_1318139 [Rhodocollybia butyracea]